MTKNCFSKIASFLPFTCYIHFSKAFLPSGKRAVRRSMMNWRDSSGLQSGYSASAASVSTNFAQDGLSLESGLAPNRASGVVMLFLCHPVY